MADKTDKKREPGITIVDKDGDSTSKKRATVEIHIDNSITWERDGESHKIPSKLESAVFIMADGSKVYWNL